jgi:hypothetical protein
MDFKSLVEKINSMADPVEVVKSPELPKSVQLNEDAQLRVLSGRTTYVAEAKKQAEEDVKEEMKVGDKKTTAKGGTVTKTEKGIVHKAGPGSYGGSDDKDTDPDADEEKAAGKKGRKRSNEAIDTEAFKGKFAKMVEAKKDEKKDDKKKKPMKEAAKPDFLDIDKDGDKKEPMKKAAGEKGDDKTAGKKGMSAKQAKFFGKKNESVSPAVKKASKKLVKESAETKLSFKQMIQLVQESGGQQQIDPVDKALFTWAQRVAANKFNESTKQEIYAGLIYERNGGVFEMYDVLSEDQK